MKRWKKIENRRLEAHFFNEMPKVRYFSVPNASKLQNPKKKVTQVINKLQNRYKVTYVTST
jgi:hypothetical protein